MTTIVAHRGLADVHPENTLSAFEAAFDMGMAVELDISTTADDKLVIMHDRTVDRTTNGSGKVGDMSLQEIRSLDAGGGARVPTFVEVCSLAAAKAPELLALVIDVKTLTRDIAIGICEALQAELLFGTTVGIGLIQSSVKVRREVKKSHPDLQCAALAETVETLPAALADPFSNWVYARFVPSADEVYAASDVKRKILVSGSQVSKDVHDAYRAYQANPAAVLTWHPCELYELIGR